MQGKVYKITRTVCGKHRGTSEEPITDKEVRSLITEAGKKGLMIRAFQPRKDSGIPEDRSLH